MKLSEKIRIIRKARGLSQEDLGANLSKTSYGISRQSVSDWENGNSEPKLDNIRDIAHVLNVSFDALLDESVNLNDADVLQKVLDNNQAATANKTQSQFMYRFYVFDKRKFIAMIVEAICTTIGIASIVTSVALLLTGNHVELFWPLIIVGLILDALAGSSLLVSLVVFKTQRFRGSVAGAITDKRVVLYSGNVAENTIFLPLEKISEIRLDPKAKKSHGDLVITVAGRQRPIVTHNIYHPQEVIDTFAKAKSFIENPDEVKIL
ncbi:MAG: helix-turn-helix domain-containing protein [Bacilli bacterium]|jgi:transcriptional regulator with XRE-family HTH domain|nr:helix-turn-helix domain-containing protein [Bacilli bacterium]